VSRGWGKAQGSGKGCGRQESKKEEVSLGTTVSGQEPASIPPSGVGGIESA
jgi:hypothetical protein